MAEHRITLRWSRGDRPFARGSYTPDHTLRFDGGQEVGASSAPDYGGNAAFADPEQLLAASLASCHMLTFLAVAANRGYVIEAYRDEAVATLGKNADGQTAVTRVVLHPRIRFGSERVPNHGDFSQLHERAHRACFIGNSIRCEVAIEAEME
jgi:organic hydroperoxide reductase OsmC/OhrA